MKQFVQKYVALEREVAAERGEMSLFALLLRDDAPDRWDLVIAAPWAVADRRAALDYLVGKIKSTLGSEELVNLSRIVLAEPNDEPVRAFNAGMHVQHGSTELRDCDFFGLQIRHAFLITSQSLERPRATGIATAATPVPA